MSYDLIFLARQPVDRTAMLKTIKRWAEEYPNVGHPELEEFSQIEYENPTTGVGALIDIAGEGEDDAEHDVESHPDLHATGCSAHFNYLRPSFFAAELTPLGAAFAKAIGAVIYDPQDDKVYEPDVFVSENPYLRHLRAVNTSFLNDADPARRPRSIDGALLHAFWQHNSGREALQQELGQTIFVPTMLAVEIVGKVQPTTAFVWGDAIPFAFHKAGAVIIVRERKGWFRTTHEFRVASFEAFRAAAASCITPLKGHDDVYLLTGSASARERVFDTLCAQLPPFPNLAEAVHRIGFMNVVDAP